MVKLFTSKRSPRVELPKKTQLTISAISSEGRGIAHHRNQTVFVEGALPGEECLVRFTGRERGCLIGEVASIIERSPSRKEPFCAYYEHCGGCDWQHLERSEQLRFKQENLLFNLKKHAGVEPKRVLTPLSADLNRYRNRAKLSVWNNKEKRRVIGFREKSSKNIVEVNTCPVLSSSLDRSLAIVQQWASDQNLHRGLDQIELIDDGTKIALVFSLNRVIAESEWDTLGERLSVIECNCDIWLRHKGELTNYPPTDILPEYSVKMPNLGFQLNFQPDDFIQANQGLNEAMVACAVDLLCDNLSQPDDASVLDLFCGIGNFSLPLAKRVKRVVGVELHQEMVEKAQKNAEISGIDNAYFAAADLHDGRYRPWLKDQFQGILLDPPRAGAKSTMTYIEKLNPQSLVYVSCNSATLVRDCEHLKQLGYQLDTLGLVDMFTYTHHSEAIASFVRKK